MAASAPDIGSLLAALGGGQGGSPGASPGAPGPVSPADPSSGGGDSTPNLVQQAISAIHQAFAQEADDPIGQHELAKILTLLQSYLATEQKEKDQVMGGPAMRTLRRNR